jgi:hypothetical protein
MQRRRPVLIAFLALGTVLGFGSTVFSHAHMAHRDAFERHVADICADSALRASGKSSDVGRAAPR